MQTAARLQAPSASVQLLRRAAATRRCASRPRSVAMAAAKTLYDFNAVTIDEQPVSLSAYKGKAVLVVNVASQLTDTNCKELGILYGKYKDQGLEVLAFPCNQFGGQEPGNNAQVKKYYKEGRSAEYPLFAKVDVNGGSAHPLFAWVREQRKVLGIEVPFKWNFEKVLFDRKGNIYDRYLPTTSPLSLEGDIAKVLAQPA